MALAKAITLIESTHPHDQLQSDMLLSNLYSFEKTAKAYTNKDVFRLGITGGPGAGKSSFIESFGTYVLNSRKMDRLAVICVDPSSTISGGSILGDKTRMTKLSNDSRAYIRPSPTRGTPGGLTAYTSDALQLCHAASYSFCILESVGSGQSDNDIHSAVDMTLLLIPPGGGDDLQGSKMGSVETCDGIIVTKFDGDTKEIGLQTASEYKMAMSFRSTREVGIYACSSHSGEQIPEVWEYILNFWNDARKSGSLMDRRREQAQFWMWRHVQNKILELSRKSSRIKIASEEMERMVMNGVVTPRRAAKSLCYVLFEKEEYNMNK